MRALALPISQAVIIVLGQVMTEIEQVENVFRELKGMKLSEAARRFTIASERINDLNDTTKRLFEAAYVLTPQLSSCELSAEVWRDLRDKFNAVTWSLKRIEKVETDRGPTGGRVASHASQGAAEGTRMLQQDQRTGRVGYVRRKWPQKALPCSMLKKRNSHADSCLSRSEARCGAKIWE